MVNNMKKIFLIPILMAGFLFASIPLAFATTITIDGDLDDWFFSGLDLSVGGDGNFSHSWNTHSDVYGIVDNLGVGDPFPPPYGGEIYDIEAMFITEDVNNMYIAIVTSFPTNGYPIVGGSG